VQQTIREELVADGIDLTRRGSDDDSTKITAAKLDSLPYLKAVIDESLRMRPTSTPLPRVTPPDRTSSVAGVDNIPPGTRINSFQWFVHRDPAKWDRVHEWLPERWLGRDMEKRAAREDVLWAFVSGPRTCLGNNLTYYSPSTSSLFPLLDIHANRTDSHATHSRCGVCQLRVHGTTSHREQLLARVAGRQTAYQGVCIETGVNFNNLEVL